MTSLYVDSSALTRCYVVDESEQAALRDLIFSPDNAAATSELARIEVASALESARRSGRAGDTRMVARQFDAETSEGGPIQLLRLRPAAVLPVAHALVTRHPLRTLDAIHLAVAMDLREDDHIVFVTRDRAQAEAALAEGFEVA
jgi:hypothetical protein